MLLKILGHSILMILALSGALIGVFMAIAEPRHALVAWPIGLVSLFLGIRSLIRIIQLNRAYQDHHLEEVLRNPAEIVARWLDGEREVIVAHRGIFLGRDYAPFAAGYQRLVSIAFDRDRGELRAGFSSIAPAPNDKPSMTLQVPAEAREAIAAFVAAITKDPPASSS